MNSEKMSIDLLNSFWTCIDSHKLRFACVLFHCRSILIQPYEKILVSQPSRRFESWYDILIAVLVRTKLVKALNALHVVVCGISLQ